MKKNLNKFLDKLIAHRGMYNKYISENSLLALEKAIFKNIPVEIDVVLTKDKIVILSHDKYFKYKNKIINITTTDYSTLHNYTKKIVTLKQVLNFINGRIPILIELKPYNKGNKLEKNIVKILDNYNGIFAIQSFNPSTINWFKNNRKKYICGQLITGNNRYNFIYNFFYKILFFNKFTKADFICYNVNGFPNKKVEKLRKKIPIIGWTIKSKEQLSKYKSYCDNFICDNIEKIMEDL